ncbi:MAG: VWA domain-containing protein, partial [Clostridia bacterium]|nr:VWA domain-containing protein [Clostridia bacterium]
MNNISFANPWLLFIALPLLAAVAVPFAITVRKDNLNFHNAASLVLHVVICICITLAVSGMSFEKVVTETNVYVLADISYSSERNLDEVQENINKISAKLPKNSKMGVICFGRNYQMIADLGESIPDVHTAEGVDRSATDIASALRYAGNLFDDGVIKRIIVITDGAETVSSSNIIRVVGALQDNGVYVDAVFIDDNIDDSVSEVQIDGVEVTASTYLNKSEEVNVLVRVSCGTADGEKKERTNGYVSLYKDGVFVQKRSASFYDGLNVVTLPLSTDGKGSFDYEVRVE